MSQKRAVCSQTAASLLLAAVYFCAAKLGLSLAFVHVSATAVWPPTGIALTALLLLGYRVWPGVLLGAFFANLTTAGTIATSMGIATGNTLEAVVGAWLLHRFANGLKVFQRAHDIFKFAVLAAFLSPMISATTGVTSLSLGGVAAWRHFFPIWSTWWLGDAIGALVVTPLLVVWATAPLPSLTRLQAVEIAGALLAVLVTGQVVFGGWSVYSLAHYPWAFVSVPPLLWMAFRFGQRGAVTATSLLSVVALTGTLRGFGPFHLREPNESLLLLQAFTGTISLTVLVFAAAVSERRQVEERLRASLREKEILLKEIHHRVKNNLQVISSLLNLQIDTVSEPAILEMFRESQDRIKSMALIHDSLYGADDLGRVDIKGYLQRLATHLLRSYGIRTQDIDVELDVEDATLTFDVAVPCGLLINELVSNALKHAFADGRSGVIRIRLHRGPEGRLTLQVSDTGPGFPPDVDLQDSESLGLRLVNTLTTQLGGTVTVDQHPGTTVTVTFTDSKRHAAPFDRPARLAQPAVQV